jgi:hypothetical protein
MKLPSSKSNMLKYAIIFARHMRPLTAAWLVQSCVAIDESSKSVVLARQRQFTFDNIYGPEASQEQLYTECVSELVDACLEGYNATVLAYGPTGSGKTYTMGSGSALHSLEDQQGVIPRAIRQVGGPDLEHAISFSALH